MGSGCSCSPAAARRRKAALGRRLTRVSAASDQDAPAARSQPLLRGTDLLQPPRTPITALPVSGGAAAQSPRAQQLPDAHLRPKSLRPVKGLLLWRRPSGGGGGGPLSGSAPPDAPEEAAAAAAAEREQEAEGEPPGGGVRAASMAALGTRRCRYRRPAPGERSGAERAVRGGRGRLPPGRAGRKCGQAPAPRRPRSVAPPAAARAGSGTGGGGSRPGPVARRPALSAQEAECQPRRRHPELGKRLGDNSVASPRLLLLLLRLPLFSTGRGGTEPTAPPPPPSRGTGSY